MKEELYTIFGSEGCFSNDKEGLFAHLRKTNKQIKYTHGLGYRHPTIDNVPISAEEAIAEFERYRVADVTEFDDYIHVNTYSGCDFD